MSTTALTTRPFPTLDVLSAISGVMVTQDFAGIGAVLTEMSGESVYTHQIPRISREARAVMLRVHPEISEAIRESKEITRENWSLFANRWLERYGATTNE